MMRGLWSAASGMLAQQTNLDVISNNLANINTTGFKKSRADFQDLMYQTMRDAGTTTGTDNKVPVGIQIGLGTRTSDIQKDFSTGDFQTTNNPLDVAIQGEGFLCVDMPDGTKAYSRDGSLKLDDKSRLVNSDGYPLDPPITIDPTAESVTIGQDGSISLNIKGQITSTGSKIQLSRFANPAGLNSIGGNLYLPTDASGTATAGDAGSDGMGTIAQNTLEMSNVQVVQEMVNMIVAQRAYESNSKAIQSCDQMLQMANQLRQ